MEILPDKNEAYSSDPWPNGVMPKPEMIFFSRNIPDDADLTSVEVDDLFHGKLGRIVNDAKEILVGLNQYDILNLLYFCDSIVANFVKTEMHAVDQNNIRHVFTEEFLQDVDPVSLASSIIPTLEKVNVLLEHCHDKDGKTFRVTVEKCFAAIALANAFHCDKFNGDSWLAENGGYYAIIATEACTIATLLANSDDQLFEVASKRTRKFLAQSAAKKMLLNDAGGKQSAKQEIYELWKDWQTGKTLHRSGAAFHRYAMNKFPAIVNPKTIERWTIEWRNENRDSAR